MKKSDIEKTGLLVALTALIMLLFGKRLRRVLRPRSSSPGAYDDSAEQLPGADWSMDYTVNPVTNLLTVTVYTPHSPKYYLTVITSAMDMGYQVISLNASTTGADSLPVISSLGTDYLDIVVYDATKPAPSQALGTHIVHSGPGSHSQDIQIVNVQK